MLKKLPFAPGVIKTNSDYAEPGRYIDAQWVRFVSGFAEKMGGYTSASSTALTGICRNIRPWRDNLETDRAAFGTHSKLLVLENEQILDITPLRRRKTGSLANALTTTNLSTSVNVTHVAHKQQVGDWVVLTAAAAVGGLTIAGNYLVATVVDVDNYTITASSAATSGAGPGGGTTPYSYSRLTLGAAPFATTNGSAVVTVTDANSLVVEGDTAIFSGAAAVAGITISGAYIVTSATTAGYTITASATANATTTGGGAVVTVQNELGIGLTDTATGYGYGAGSYGLGTYGTVRGTSGVTLMLRTWSLHAYGEWLLANPRGGAIYVWDPITYASRAIELYNAPTQCLAMFVTEERYIIALGKDADDLKIGWADQEDPTQWTQTAANTANESRKIQGGNFIMSGGQVRNQTSLIWTDTSAFLHQWRADDFVFTTAKLADNSGLFGPNSFCVEGEIAYWVGDGQFWRYDGSLDMLPSDDIRQWFFENVDRDQRSKVVMGAITAFNELVILYPEIGQSEINRYLLYNIKEQTWATGSLARTAWHDRSLFPYPLAADASGGVWSHEYGVDAAGSAIDSYLTAAPIDIEDGETNIDIFSFLPDIKDQAGSLSLYLLTRNNAMDTPTSDGPYTLGTTGSIVDVRSAGKMAGFKMESNAIGGNFRIGVCRVDVQSSGARR